MRRDWVPRTPAPFDFETAIHTGPGRLLLPAMDDWRRTIVRPLALEGFRRAMREDRAAYEAAAPIDAALAGEYDRWSRRGDLVLHRFFAFAAAFDDFDSVLADDDLWVPVPDPDRPGFELGTRDGRPIRYLCRLDQLIADTDDEWWVVDHRSVVGRLGQRRRAAGRAAHDPNVVGARDRIPPDPCRGHRAQPARGPAR